MNKIPAVFGLFPFVSPSPFLARPVSGFLAAALLLALQPRLHAEPEGTQIADKESASAPIQAWRPGETKEQRDARMAWWKEAKFGMFIHWGLYAIDGGFRNGKNYNSEWMYAHAAIPVSEYKAQAASFNPQKFDADAIVKLAKEAGQKYIVITTKHHDGFAMYPSRASTFNIRDASPFKRDPIRELVDACRREGIKLGFYYSQGQDWTNPGGGFTRSSKGPWDEAQKGDFENYFNKVAMAQVRELLTDYGPDMPALFWFDTPTGNMTPARVEKILPLLREHPGLIINNRLRYGGPGDFSTPEAYIPPKGFVDRDWESCIMMNEHWGYSSRDHKWKNAGTLIRQLIDVVSKGGNYLLNIGPKPDGSVPVESVEPLKHVGAWMRVNGEAIYGSSPTIFGEEAGHDHPTQKVKGGKPKFIPVWEWRCTTKKDRIYLHLFKWPASAIFTMPPIGNKVTKAYMLSDPKREALKFCQTPRGVEITLPAKAPDPHASVICLEVEGMPVRATLPVAN